MRRVVVYSLATGALAGHAFGAAPVVSAAGGRVVLENGSGRLTVHDVSTMRRLAELTFAQPIVFKTFNAEGTRLFVLTADHTTFLFDVAAASGPS
jgi:hypothetical protein